MDIQNFDIDEYNKRFAEETKDYAKICNGLPCQYADECEMKVFCNRDGEKKELRYIRGFRSGNGYFSFNGMCKRDIPDGGYTREHLETFYQFGKLTFPNIMPPSIGVWIEELKEMGMYKESEEQHANENQQL